MLVNVPGVLQIPRGSWADVEEDSLPGIPVFGGVVKAHSSANPTFDGPLGQDAILGPRSM